MCVQNDNYKCTKWQFMCTKWQFMWLLLLLQVLEAVWWPERACLYWGSLNRAETRTSTGRSNSPHPRAGSRSPWTEPNHNHRAAATVERAIWTIDLATDNSCTFWWLFQYRLFIWNCYTCLYWLSKQCGISQLFW